VLRPAPEGEDLTLLDARDPAEAAALAAALRAQASPALAIVMATTGASPPARNADWLDAWVAFDAPPTVLARRLKSVFRDGVLAAEVDARTLTATALGLAAPRVDGPEPRRFAALFVGAPTPHFLEMQRALQRLGGRMQAAFTSFSAFDHLHDDAFDALVLQGEDDGAALLSLLTALRRNSRLHDMPAYFLASDEKVLATALARGADETVALTSDLDVAAAWLAEDVRRARRRRLLMKALAAPIAPTNEAFRFFSYHLAGLAQTHHDRGRQLTVAILEVGDHKGRQTPGWRRGFGEIATLCARLVRAADSTAVVDDGRIAFAFPSTPLAGGEAAVKRVIGVCECTAFAAGDGGERPIGFRSRVVELSPGESGAGLLGRALHYRQAQHA
jgi:two-component system cell cycle response regulator PopA